jgi:histidinol-phosphate/aromatic aminotransferase/cobyric acid decarboxylase-like protein
MIPGTNVIFFRKKAKSQTEVIITLTRGVDVMITFLCQIFGENILKIITSVPDFLKMFSFIFSVNDDKLGEQQTRTDFGRRFRKTDDKWSEFQSKMSDSIVALKLGRIH